MIHKVPFKKFYFRKPNDLDTHGYYKLKMKLRKNESFSIIPNFNYRETFENEIGVLKFIFYSFLASILLKSLSNLFDIKIFHELHGIPLYLGGLVFVFSCLSFIPTIISLWEYKVDEYKYFNQLKKDILLSSSYPDFLIIRGASK